MTRELTTETLDALRADAKAAPRRRQHLNLHHSYADPCQRFLNALCRDSYIRPHRHLQDPKEELLVAVAGVFALCVFDDAGALVHIKQFATEAHWRPGTAFAASVSPETWHSVIALTDGAVLLEMKAGPFDPLAAKEPAPWAPDETDEGAARAYLAMLHRATADADLSVGPDQRARSE